MPRHLALSLCLFAAALVASAEAKGPKMVLVEAGAFGMGCPDGTRRDAPLHPVRITRPFLIAAFATTVEEYEAYCAETGRRRPRGAGEGGSRAPVRSVNWYDAIEYCNWLSAREGLEPCYSGKGKLVACDFEAPGYRLPTEAEWEYAAGGGPLRGGEPFAGSENPEDTAWYEKNSGGFIHDVGLKAPNPLGIYDLSGNLFEWCWDWYDAGYYAVSPLEDPRGPEAPDTNLPWRLERSRRGGSWREAAADIAIWSRSQDYASYVGDNGIRLVRTAK